jgi:translation initiation factor 2 beta subunit (eIF-2beta)/eIF-5
LRQLAPEPAATSPGAATSSATPARPIPQGILLSAGHRNPAAPARPGLPAATPAVRPGAGRTPPPKTGAARVDDMILVMRQLSELLTKENLSLRRYRVQEVKVFTERKEQLARLYQNHMNALHRDTSIVKNLDAGKRAALTQMATRLAELMRENASMLQANLRAIDTFFKAVTDAVRERQESKSASYSRNGMLNGYTAVKRNLAITYNQTT